jgi:ATP/maltotriose-dependent transcriptional regulator MalT/two-component SAPR family response regulator
MASRDPLIRHAIAQPAFDERISLHRERLVDAIHANIPRKLIAIAAPAGYGKTTLLADFGSNTDLTVCWARLTQADWDIMRFSQVLAASLQGHFRRLNGQPDLAALATASPEALALAFSSAISDYITEAFVIALDDVHLINASKPVLAFLDRFLQELPEQVTVIAAGREVPEVSLARLMAERDLAGFGPQDLALTREELIDLTQKQGRSPLSDFEIDRLLEESRGWVTGIVMSGTLADRGLGSLVNAGRPMMFEYLASVVLNQQPDELRRFALDAAVLPIMTEESCNVVLGREDSRRLLNQLVRRALFVTATEGSLRTYEFHPLFREFLLASLQGADLKRIVDLRRRAANYHLGRGSLEQAVDLLIEAGSVRQAAKAAERHAPELFESGRVQTIERWVERFRAENAPVPNLTLALVTSLRNRGDLSGAERLLGEVEQAISPSSNRVLLARFEINRGYLMWQFGKYEKALEAADRVDRIFANRSDRHYQGLAMNIRALALAHGKSEFAKAEQSASEAVELLSRAGNEFYQWAALNDLMLIQDAQGNALEANRTRERALSLARKIGAPLPLAVALGNRAMGAHQEGEYEMALGLGREALKQARQAASPLREAISLLRQADVFNDIGLALQAAELYGEALSILTRLDNADWIRYACTRTSVLHRRRGGAGLAHEWLRRAMLADESKVAPPEIRVQFAALEIQAAPEQAIKTIRGLLKRRATSLEAAQVTLMQYFQAVAELKLAHPEQAVELLSQAFTQAGRSGTEQVIAAELRFDIAMREFAVGHFGTDPTYSVIRSRIEMMEALSDRHEVASESEPEGARIEVQALGSSRILVGGVEPRELKPLTREILFYLIDRERVRRDKLMEEFWPDQSSGRQVTSLHTAIYGIRSCLGKDSILFDGTVYQIDPSTPVDYDVARFEKAALVAERLLPGDPRLLFALTEAVRSYQGDFHPELDRAWVDERRRTLELKYLDLMASYSQEALVRDRPSEALDLLRQAIRLNPLRDDTNRYYMEALGRLGRRSELVAHYQDYVQLLRQELALDPPPHLTELYDRLIS